VQAAFRQLVSSALGIALQLLHPEHTSHRPKHFKAAISYQKALLVPDVSRSNQPAINFNEDGAVAVH
jgi:hypothetical protein